MTPALVNQIERRRVAGIATRTTNADEMQSSQARIPGLWGEFASQNWAERLGQSGAFGPTMAVVMRAAATDVHEQVIPDAGHWLMEEQPAATIAAVRAFLDR